MARTYWFPSTRAGQLLMFTNVKAKIAGYATELDLSAPDIAAVILICDTFIAVDMYVEFSKATMEALVEWRDIVYEDEDKKGPADAPPDFPTFTAPAGMSNAIFDDFRKAVDQWKAADGYTLAIGEDLMIVGNEITPDPIGSTAPELKVEARPEYVVRISGRMQGMSALRVEYKRSGAASFAFVGVLTSLSGELPIAPQTPGSPETGNIRAIFLKKNEPYGNYSPEYPVTIAQ